jgi:DNA repair protein RadA/Sms
MSEPEAPEQVAAFHCYKCKETNVRWTERCQACGEQATMLPAGMDAPPSEQAAKQLVKMASQIDARDWVRVACGIPRLDLLYGGGIPLDFIIQFSGPPGTGKSTILTQLVAGAIAPHGLYVAVEEPEARVVQRARRFGLTNDFPIVHTEDVADVRTVMRQTKPKIVVVDSLAALTQFEIDDEGKRRRRPKSQYVTRDIAIELIAEAHKQKCCVFLLCHVNKGEEPAGLREVTHLVDAETRIEGDPKKRPRTIWNTKNRAGDTTYKAKFNMTEVGYVERADDEPDEPSVSAEEAQSNEEHRRRMAEFFQNRRRNKRTT